MIAEGSLLWQTRVLEQIGELDLAEATQNATISNVLCFIAHNST